jgi:hypothetical protein
MPVTTETLITADYFNTLQAKITSVIFGEYGYISQFPVQPVTTGTFITTEEWKNLFFETTKCIIHQTNADISGYVYTTTNITTNTVITAAFVNAIETAVDDAFTNRHTIHPSQKIVEVISDARTLPWNNGTSNAGISNSTIIEFDDQTNPELDLLYWLNLGGSISLELTYPDESYSGYDLFWKNFIDTANASLSSYTFNLANSSTYVFEIFGPDGVEDLDSDADGRIRIDVFKDEANNRVEIVTNFLSISPDMNSDTMNINVGVDITLVSSSGNAGPEPYGIPSVVPIVDRTLLDETSREISLIKYLKTNPRSLEYTFERGQTSTNQTITLFNRGNDTVTVSGINYTGGLVGVTAIPTYSWGETPELILAPGESRTFQLKYTYAGGFEGENFSTISIISDGIINPWYIDVKQTIQKPVFDFTLTPSVWNYTTSTIDIVDQSFTLIPKLFTNYTSYTASISPSPAGFSVESRTGTLPRVRFNPYIASGGTYTPVLTVQATDGITTVSRTANINIVYNEETSQHLGDWISAGAYNNAIVGASYDIIRGVRYLTLGVGVGSEDGTPEIVNGGLTYAIIGNLGINADSKIKSGTALFRIPFNQYQLLDDYGVTIRSLDNLAPRNTFINRVYKINIESDGIYNWQFNVYKYGSVTIDDAVLSIIDVDKDVSTSEGLIINSQPTSGEIFLLAGEHTITVKLAVRTNDLALDASVAFRLYDSTREIWNTLEPVRSTTPYYYWKEVYRIPLTNGAYTYDSRDYCIKDFSPVAGYRYGGYFQDGNIFKVVDDGFGNLEILLQQKTISVSDAGIESTLKNLQYSFYYYILYLADNQRVNQLAGPIGQQTQYFVGFTSSGEVRTRLVNFLTFGRQPQIWDTGGEGGFTPSGGFVGVLTDGSGNIVTALDGTPIGGGGLPNAPAADLAAADGFSPEIGPDAVNGISQGETLGAGGPQSGGGLDNQGSDSPSGPSGPSDPGGQGGGGVPGAGA